MTARPPSFGPPRGWDRAAAVLLALMATSILGALVIMLVDGADYWWPW